MTFHLHPMEATEDEKYYQAAADLMTAFKGAGTNENTVIEIASHFNAEERYKIATFFVGKYGEHLETYLKKELSGTIYDLVSECFKDRYNVWARYVHESIKGAGTNEKQLIEQVLLMSDEDQVLVDKAYKELYGTRLVNDIEGDISHFTWNRLLRQWLYAKNEMGAPPEEIADALHKACEGAGTDEQLIGEVLSHTHPALYKQVSDCFMLKYKKDFVEYLKSEFVGSNQIAFITAHDFLSDQAVAVSRILKQAVKGAGTDEYKLIRMTVLFGDRLRHEDLIHGYAQFGDLEKDIRGDFSGYSKKAVLAMWGFKWQ